MTEENKTEQVENTPTEADGSVSQGNLINTVVQLLKRYNGYPYASISRITSIPAEQKDQSFALTQIIMTQLAMGQTDQEEFKKRFVNNDIAIVQLHSSIPELAKDGVYNHKNPNGYVKSIIMPGFYMLDKPDIFKPVIICRNPGVASADIGKPGTLGLIEGDPYRKITAAEVAEIIKATQPEAVAQVGEAPIATPE